MDEYEKLESELKALYDDYIVKFRCLSFLETQVIKAFVTRCDQVKFKGRGI